MLGRIVIILSVAHHIHGFAPPPDKCPEPDKSWLFTGTGLFTGEGELQLQEGKPHGSFVFEKASNVIAFMDRPGREAHTMTLPEVARAFEGREESNPPNGVLTITMKHGTHEESMVSIPVTLETHTYYPEMDKMGFTYTILGHFTPRQIEALYCQQCPLSIFVDNLFRTLYTWATPAPLSGVDAFDPGSCCNAGLQKINDGTMVAGPCKEGGGCTPCSSAWLSNTYCKTGQYCMEASALKKNTCKDFTTAWGISKGDIACDPNRGTCECPLGMTPKVNDENPPSSNGCARQHFPTTMCPNPARHFPTTRPYDPPAGAAQKMVGPP